MSRLLTASWLSSVLVAGALIGAPSWAQAQTDAERAGARAAAQQGIQAFSEGRYADAVDLLTRAESVVHAPPHLLYMARAQEKQGRLVEARELYTKVTRETLAPTAPEAFRNAQAEANTELAALEPRIPYLVIALQPPDAQGVKVLLDGVELPAALIGLEAPVNPGTHRVVAVSGATEGTPQEVEIAEGAHIKVEVAPPVAAPVVAPVAPTPVQEQDQGGSDPGRGLRIGSYVAFGVGAVGLGVGTVFLIKGMGHKSDADDAFDACNPGCNTTEQRTVTDLEDDAASAKTISLVGYVGGAVGIGAGVALLVLSNKASAEGNHARVTPWVGWQSAGVSGTF